MCQHCNTELNDFITLGLSCTLTEKNLNEISLTVIISKLAKLSYLISGNSLS